MNRSLQPKGINIKAILKNGCLQVMLEAAQVPDQREMISFIRNEIINLKAESIKKARISARQQGEDFSAYKPAWTEDIELSTQIDVTLPSTQSSNEAVVIETRDIQFTSDPSGAEVKITIANVGFNNRNQSTSFSVATPYIEKSVPVRWRLDNTDFEQQWDIRISKGGYQSINEKYLSSTIPSQIHWKLQFDTVSSCIGCLVLFSFVAFLISFCTRQESPNEPSTYENPDSGCLGTYCWGSLEQIERDVCKTDPSIRGCEKYR
jgi:hypothetical protein